MSTTGLFVAISDVLTPANDPGRLLPGVAEALQRLQQRGVPVVAAENAEADVAAHLLGACSDAGCELTAVQLAPADATPAQRLPRPGLLLSAANDHALDLFSSWVVSASPGLIEAGAQAGCVGAVLLGDCPEPPPHVAIHAVRARDFADAPRVMIPPGGGCWHDPR